MVVIKKASQGYASLAWMNFDIHYCWQQGNVGSGLRQMHPYLNLCMMGHLKDIKQCHYCGTTIAGP